MAIQLYQDEVVVTLARAAESARKHFQQFFESLDYEEVRIIIDDHPL